MKYHIRRLDTKGLLDGIFFEIEVPFGTEGEDVPRDAVLVGGVPQDMGADWMLRFKWLQLVNQPDDVIHASQLCDRCAADGEYTMTVYVVERIAVELLYGEIEGGFFPQQDPRSDYYFVTTGLADCLRRSGTIGVEFGGVTQMQRKDGTLQENPPIVVLNCVGKGCDVSGFVLSDEVKNSCPFCGKSPILCPECGQIRTPCKNCGKLFTVSADCHDGGSDARLTVEPASEALRIVDGGRWDGSDFSCNGLITKRALDLLLRSHAGPLWYRPALLDTTGVTNAKMQQILELKEAKALTEQ